MSFFELTNPDHEPRGQTNNGVARGAESGIPHGFSLVSWKAVLPYTERRR